MMQMHENHPWTGCAFFAKLTLARGEVPALEVCPFRPADDGCAKVEKP